MKNKISHHQQLNQIQIECESNEQINDLITKIIEWIKDNMEQIIENPDKTYRDMIKNYSGYSESLGEIMISFQRKIVVFFSQFKYDEQLLKQTD